MAPVSRLAVSLLIKYSEGAVSLSTDFFFHRIVVVFSTIF